MSVGWWIVVIWLAAAFCVTLGWVLRVEFERYNRNVYDIDLTRRKAGQ